MAPAPIVVLISGTGSNLAALLDASRAEGSSYEIVGVIADREAAGLAHARNAGIPTEVVRLKDFPDRDAWNHGVRLAVDRFAPQLIVLAGFMKLFGPELLEAYPDRIINTHPALLPSFPGAHGVRDALAYGVRVTGATVFVVDAGIDTGRILAQEALTILPEDDETSLHERIKAIERRMLVDVVEQLTR
ncbi:phosphoribosylglycinamide formyltransferase [Brachybacterium hainanense]|uniref:Phosphoribosylglycinamide formyltransferase n=1 Tax=Brachybacterium hainanense TaxID=1541174 RepID=A0ABV6RFM3_9MICO